MPSSQENVAADNKEQMKNEEVGESRKNDNETGGGGKNKQKDEPVCRDFLNDSCKRGSLCKFYHPENVEPRKCAADEPYDFCKDYQNKNCRRENCRFVHAWVEDVDRYRRSGEVSLELARALAALSRSDTIAGIPLCKQFQWGRCERGDNCRFWHINVEEERRKRIMEIANSSGSGSRDRSGRDYGRDRSGRDRDGWRPSDDRSSSVDRRGGSRGGRGWPRDDSRGAGGGRGGDFRGSDGPPAAKRVPPTFQQPYPTANFQPQQQQMPGPQAFVSMQQIPLAAAAAASRPLIDPAAMAELERRNAELMTEIESLRRENRRERERYEDLLTLFRQTAGTAASVGGTATEGQGQVGQQQQNGGTTAGYIGYTASPMLSSQQSIYPTSAGQSAMIGTTGSIVASQQTQQYQSQQQQQQQYHLSQPQQQQPQQLYGRTSVDGTGVSVGLSGSLVSQAAQQQQQPTHQVYSWATVDTPSATAQSIYQATYGGGGRGYQLD